VKGVYHFNPLDAHRSPNCAATTAARFCWPRPRSSGPMHGAARGRISARSRLWLQARRNCRRISRCVRGAVRDPPIEGYGTTELSPLVSVNIPPTVRRVISRSVGRKAQWVGQCRTSRPRSPIWRPELNWGWADRACFGSPVPTSCKATWPRGRNRRSHQGWLVHDRRRRLIDEDGFIRITGRESRFSKIGGEMVPHLQIEEVLSGVAGLAEDGAPRLVVTAVPDPRKENAWSSSMDRSINHPTRSAGCCPKPGCPIFTSPPRQFSRSRTAAGAGLRKLDLRKSKSWHCGNSGQRRTPKSD